MSIRTATRPFVLASLLVAGWLVVAATSAAAWVAPDPPQILAPPGPAPITAAVAGAGTPVLSFLLVAAVACLVAVAATLAVQTIVRRTQQRHAVASA